ncbi:HFR054Wp [Eremothecium sinecaudum]|uniref:CDP-diacylglycerol--glycerol-3-phosphate 3-phosphatidyltransferase n=1 Tax=Eremothecium sinecaudum TaxID=45286 RepID=A0A0X8HUZ4_9SACH|nr:HFR054Wp [Eremothecium sinecaudum]AMD21909.1 HFR054Wp [Eremothecium sinecaudum]
MVFRRLFPRPINIKGDASMSISCVSHPNMTFTDIVKDKLSFLKSKFYFKTGEIEIIETPYDFYECLKTRISLANDRIFLASLYLGKTEEELIKCIGDALKAKPDLKVHFLIDGLRGTRETPKTCSASLIAQLAKEHGERINIRLYKTPAYVGWKRWLIPSRFNEGIGLQHMKIYGFDNSVILSGANLSSDYFSNRQDRYYLFNSTAFSNYYFKLHQLISKMSYQVTYSDSIQKYKVSWPASNISTEPRANRRKFIHQSSAILSKFLLEDHGEVIEQSSEAPNDYPTVVYPISQFTPLFKPLEDKSTEKKSILKLLSLLNSPSNEWVFTAGYFNILPEIQDRLLGKNSSPGKIITASPFANGFYKSKGVSKHLPAAYLYLSKKFLQTVHKLGKDSYVSLYEWKKGIVNEPNGWSYHAKGIWLTANKQADDRPSVTVIGSSNYTKRAYSLDLENNAIVVTEDDHLRSAMKQEVENLFSNTKLVTLDNFAKEEDRKVKLGVIAATKILGKGL